MPTHRSQSNDNGKNDKKQKTKKQNLTLFIEMDGWWVGKEWMRTAVHK